MFQEISIQGVKGFSNRGCTLEGFRARRGFGFRVILPARNYLSMQKKGNGSKLSS